MYTERYRKGSGQGGGMTTEEQVLWILALACAMFIVFFLVAWCEILTVGSYVRSMTVTHRMTRAYWTSDGWIDRGDEVEVLEKSKECYYITWWDPRARRYRYHWVPLDCVGPLLDEGGQ
jgi:hypothetical protein